MERPYHPGLEGVGGGGQHLHPATIAPAAGAHGEAPSSSAGASVEGASQRQPRRGQLVKPATEAIGQLIAAPLGILLPSRAVSSAGRAPPRQGGGRWSSPARPTSRACSSSGLAPFEVGEAANEDGSGPALRGVAASWRVGVGRALVIGVGPRAPPPAVSRAPLSRRVRARSSRCPGQGRGGWRSRNTMTLRSVCLSTGATNSSRITSCILRRRASTRAILRRRRGSLGPGEGVAHDDRKQDGPRCGCRPWRTAAGVRVQDSHRVIRDLRLSARGRELGLMSCFSAIMWPPFAPPIPTAQARERAPHRRLPKELSQPRRRGRSSRRLFAQATLTGEARTVSATSPGTACAPPSTGCPPRRRPRHPGGSERRSAWSCR